MCPASRQQYYNCAALASAGQLRGTAVWCSFYVLVACTLGWSGGCVGHTDPLAGATWSKRLLGARVCVVCAVIPVALLCCCLLS